ncbi:hypothetical protein FE810_11015 [Thalassotalea litorea]|uniref:Lipoyl-binding domain-containing protein n=1 Tax=Thalassotalea litorea TaxID=2020715 RepID=A0A5R9IGF3_9GAMM|nr:biotin/lipoyl-containing protein [Thalassotalea litorea]TLU64614.1 hypothetical protein FE810_11015 [Thalassotalea litorea]
MNIDIRIPEFGDKNEQAVVLDIYVHQGMPVNKDDILFNVETDKVVLEVSAPERGTISEMMIEPGALVTSGQIVLQLSDNRPMPANPEPNPSEDNDLKNAGKQSEQSVNDEPLFSEHDSTLEVEQLTNPTDNQSEIPEPVSENTDSERGAENTESAEPTSVPQPQEKPNDIPTTTSFSPLQIALLFGAICAMGLLISFI